MGFFPEADHKAIGTRLDAVLAVPELQALLDRYFAAARSNRFAGSLFDSLGMNDPDHFTSDDLVAASLLDVRFGPPAVRALLEDEKLNELLRLVPRRRHFYEMATDPALYDQTLRLYSAVMALHQVGDTRASKLLARKRPLLVPIGDSVVKAVLQIEFSTWWRPLARALTPRRRARLDAFGRPKRVSSLRVLDVSLWMLGSNSRDAQQARASVGLSREPWHLGT